MRKDLIISCSRHETKVAILEDEQLVEIYFERPNEYSLVGSIHKGRVTRVLPGMQSAFVNIGLERDAFLYVSDFFEPPEEVEPIQVTPSAEAAVVAEKPAVEAQRQAATLERGHRGRRRRRRGLPKEKYAAVGSGGEAHGGHRGFVVLPGESLAKYGGSPTPRPVGEVEELELLGQAESAAPEDVSAVPEQEQGEVLVSLEQPPVEAVSESTTEPASEALAPEPEKEGPETPLVHPEPESGEVGDVAKLLAGESTAETEVQAVAAVEPEEAPTAETPTLETAPEDAGPEPSVGEMPQQEEATPAVSGEPEENVLAGRTETPLVVAAVQEAADTEVAAPSTPVPDEELSEERIGPELSEEPTASEPEPTDQSVEVHSGEEPESKPSSVRLRRQHHRYMRRSNRGRSRRSSGASAHHPTSEPEARGGSPKTTPSITELLREGQELIVQVAKEPIGQKGARITCHVTLPGRYVVYMPTIDHLGVSRKISNDQERQRLRRILQSAKNGIPGGFIVRTAAEGKSESEIIADMKYLYNLWLEIRRKAEKVSAPALLYHDLDVIERVLRDQLNEEFDTIWVDDEQAYERVVRFLEKFQPNMLPRARLYTRSTPIFDAFNITQELEKALKPKVWLKSGGYIVINQTEALVAIDVNTGKFVGQSDSLEDTIVRTNLEAVKEIVRQIRLRDLGGIIVVDFIDMEERKNRQKVMQALEEAMRVDRAPYNILQFNDFGLVAITRKRVKQSLERTLCSPCPYCEGAGYIKSVDTVISEILTQARRMARALEGETVVLRVHPDVARAFKSKGYREELEEILGRPVMITSDPLLHHEKFDFA